MRRAITYYLPLLIFSLVFTSCATLELMFNKPEVKFNDLKIVGFDLRNIELEVSYELVNPYSFAFLINSINYVFSIDGSVFLNEKVLLNKEVPANQKSHQSMRLQLNYRSIGHIFSEILAKQKIQTKFEGGIDVGFPKELRVLEQVNIPFSYSKELNVRIK